MAKIPRTRPKFELGDWVAWTSGNSRHVAQVIEQIGPVGLKAVQYYKLREYVTAVGLQDYEFAERSLEPASEADLAMLPPDMRAGWLAGAR